jgi:hypothetical protein
MSNKFSVLLMRDDSNVRRFRVGSFWLKLLVYIEVLLIILAAGGIYAGYTFWRQNAMLEEQRVVLEKRLREAHVHLERLQNVEKILQSNDPEELQTLLGSMSIDKRPERPPIDLGKLFRSVDKQQAVVDNMSVKAVRDNSLRVSFDLNNADSSRALSGHVELALVTKDGMISDVEANDEDLGFQIQRYKKIVTTFPLPEGMLVKDIFGLRVTIKNPSDATVFSETYQLSEFMS